MGLHARGQSSTAKLHSQPPTHTVSRFHVSVYMLGCPVSLDANECGGQRSALGAIP